MPSEMARLLFRPMAKNPHLNRATLTSHSYFCGVKKSMAKKHTLIVPL